MTGNTEDFEKIKYIAFLAFLDKDIQEDLNFNNYISLRKLSANEKDDYFKKYEQDDYFRKNDNFVFTPNELTHCLEYKIDKISIEKSEKFVSWIVEKTENYLSKNNDNFSPMNDKNKNEIIKDHLYDQMEREIENLINAMNLVCEIPIKIIAMGEYSEDTLATIWEYKQKSLPIFKRKSEIKKSSIEKINEIFFKINNIEINEAENNEDWWLISLEYFDKSLDFDWLEDQFIYLSISLESLLSGPDDNGEISYRLRLRSSLYLQKIANIDSEFVQKIIKEFYNIRSKIVHGNSDTWKIEETYVTINGIKISAQSLRVIVYDLIKFMLCDTILYHDEDSKREFINFIDNIWKKDDCDIPYDLEKIRDYWDQQ